MQAIADPMLQRLLMGLAMALTARTFASAFPARAWATFGIYVTAPVLGMLLAAEVYVRRHGLHQVICAKLPHHNSKRCIRRPCGYHADRDRPLAAER